MTENSDVLDSSAHTTVRKLPYVVDILQWILSHVISLGRCLIVSFYKCLASIFSLSVIEAYRQGPQQHNDWNFLLWRLTFPIFTLIICLLVVGLGDIGGVFYVLTACPIWYVSSLVLIAYPYFLIYRYRHVGDRFRKILWRAFVLIAYLITFVEYFFTSGADRMSWIMGNSMFGIFGLVIIPLFFYMQPRCVRESIDRTLGETVCSPPTTPVQKAKRQSSRKDIQYLITTEHSGIYSPPSSRMKMELIDPEETTVLRHSSSLPLLCTLVEESDKWIQYSTPNQTTKISYGVFSSLCIMWIITWVTYLSPYAGKHRASYWNWLSVLVPVNLLIIRADSQKNLTFNFSYLVFYTTTLVHVPDLLGHMCLYVFSTVEAEANEHMPTWAFLVKFGISVGFIVTMQGYFYIMTRVVQLMSEPFSHPSLLYLGQLYFYLFWYMLVSNDTPIDMLYIAMLVVNNLHIVFSNTGLYHDIRRWHDRNGIRVPLSMCMGSSVLCYRRANFIPLRFSCASRFGIGRRRKARDSNMSESLDVELNVGHESTFSTNAEVSEQMKSLYFLMKMAEQDNMADTSALILVPSLLTVLACLEEPDDRLAVLLSKTNLWLRCIFMFLGRILGSHLAREVFAYKLKRRMKLSASPSTTRRPSSAEEEEAINNRLLIQNIMLQDFQRQFWYLTVVTVICTFVCFERAEWPIRYAFVQSIN